MKRVRKKIDLDNISDEDLLNVRISDLPICLEGTWIEGCVEQLHSELKERGIDFLPECYLADEWLTPEKETCIGIPFYLAHPALIRLEKKFMFEAEGEGRDWCMKLLRHEAGHALSYAYRFYNRGKWQKIFGPSTKVYADTYKYRPYSKNFVKHLDGFYAQYHPDEDFVETFAVWLTPGINWEKRYAKWKALEKLEYVDRLMKEIKGKKAKVTSSQNFWRQSTLRYTLKTYYKKKRKLLAEEFPDFHDPFLWKLFQKRDEDSDKAPTATEMIRKHRRTIMNNVSRFSGERKYIINDLLKDIQKRSQELRLVSEEDEFHVALSLTSYITSLVMNYQYTGQFCGDRKKKK